MDTRKCADNRMLHKQTHSAVSIALPNGFVEAFKKLAIERKASGDAPGRHVAAQDLHEEAVRAFLGRLARHETVVFAPTFRKRQRRIMWLTKDLYYEVREAAQRCQVSVSTLVLTACLVYLETNRIKLDTSAIDGRSDA
ncbi:MAG: hypothetical protein U1E42_16300 [Rhodospirillales bacterium]